MSKISFSWNSLDQSLQFEQSVALELLRENKHGERLSPSHIAELALENHQKEYENQFQKFRMVVLRVSQKEEEEKFRKEKEKEQRNKIKRRKKKNK
jgi:hypothetical protein